MRSVCIFNRCCRQEIRQKKLKNAMKRSKKRGGCRFFVLFCFSPRREPVPTSAVVLTLPLSDFVLRSLFGVPSPAQLVSRSEEKRKWGLCSRFLGSIS